MINRRLLPPSSGAEPALVARTQRSERGGAYRRAALRGRHFLATDPLEQGTVYIGTRGRGAIIGHSR